jgi:hypothetical protein
MSRPGPLSVAAAARPSARSTRATAIRARSTKLRCGTCGKGYDDAERLAAHTRAHGRAVTDVAAPPRGFWARVAQEQAEELRLLRAQSRCSGEDQCQVSAQDRNNGDVVFPCWTCKDSRRWHWVCVGYKRTALASLPVVVCPRCLVAKGKSPAACELAAIGRRLLEEHVRLDAEARHSAHASRRLVPGAQRGQRRARTRTMCSRMSCTG